MENYNYNMECPHCQRAITVSRERESNSVHVFNIDNPAGELGLYSVFILCPNKECQKITIKAKLSRTFKEFGYIQEKEELQTWNLVPEGKAKKFPDYIPTVIIKDYEEAFSIVELSPKASATLSRRALQGILRDFWKVKPQNLNMEIESIKDRVDGLTWDAIDSIRKIGNIGAHMEKDINIILDVDPEEAHLLISLIETLLTEWYVGRAERESRMKAIKATADSKKH
ncbi:DUF4145 domain-containing protein [Janthinobacterium violaceinigrum]|uniref:DUF4145 domain-containing protein n=1 Tax=Janthinobacterium violaceinigrum TaxID=2654252 RepID=A0A6I1I5P3_9BURK|nr:DUF4145 domain-containing protein [Janthinobacterium violaceinigrum]KAB8066282.1 DUF4145 domain-containing protein [Janthinobacterium violaceinigrum]